MIINILTMCVARLATDFRYNDQIDTFSVGNKWLYQKLILPVIHVFFILRLLSPHGLK